MAFTSGDIHFLCYISQVLFLLARTRTLNTFNCRRRQSKNICIIRNVNKFYLLSDLILYELSKY